MASQSLGCHQGMVFLLVCLGMVLLREVAAHPWYWVRGKLHGDADCRHPETSYEFHGSPVIDSGFVFELVDAGGAHVTSWEPEAPYNLTVHKQGITKNQFFITSSAGAFTPDPSTNPSTACGGRAWFNAETRPSVAYSKARAGWTAPPCCTTLPDIQFFLTAAEGKMDWFRQTSVVFMAAEGACACDPEVIAALDVPPFFALPGTKSEKQADEVEGTKVTVTRTNAGDADGDGDGSAATERSQPAHGRLIAAGIAALAFGAAIAVAVVVVRRRVRRRAYQDLSSLEMGGQADWQEPAASAEAW